MPPLLLLLAAGLGTRFGGEKPLAAVTAGGATLLDFAIFDAARSGFGRPIIVIRPELEDAWRRHLREQFGASLAFTLVHQGAPLGTGHALLCAAEHLDRPFAVANADDFYGRGAYAHLARHLSGPTADNCVTVYRLGDTLSPHGGVSRAVCRSDAAGSLTEITEVLDIRDVGGQIRGRTPGGTALTLTGDEHISMSLFGLLPGFVVALGGEYDRFREAVSAPQTVPASQTVAAPEAEFRLSDATGEMVRRREVRVRLMLVREPGFGVTYAGDVADTRARIEALIERGEYPTRFNDVSVRSEEA